MGRKRIDIDKDQFEELLELQCTKEDISGFFHCSHDTIERFCKKTYGNTFYSVSETFKSRGRVSLRRSQFAVAEKGNVPMLIHLGKQYLGQADKTEAKVTGDLNMKQGDITKILYYDPETGKTTKEEIIGKENDVNAYCDKPEDYNGDTMTFKVPQTDQDPDPSDIEGEKTLISKDGKMRLHLPYDGMEPLPVQIKVKTRDSNGDTVILEEVDDGRGGYTGDPQKDLIIEQALEDNKRVRLEWAKNK